MIQKMVPRTRFLGVNSLFLFDTQRVKSGKEKSKESTSKEFNAQGERVQRVTSESENTIYPSDLEEISEKRVPVSSDFASALNIHTRLKANVKAYDFN